jgi:hypothetical protein
MVREFHPPIPSQRATQPSREQVHLAREPGGDGFHVAPIDLDKNSEPCRTLNDSGDLSDTSTKEKVSLPMAGNRAIFNLGWAFGDRDRILDLRPPLTGDVIMHAATDRPPGSKMLLQLFGEHAT